MNVVTEQIETIEIPLKKLTEWEANVRTTNATGRIEELAASKTPDFLTLSFRLMPVSYFFTEGRWQELVGVLKQSRKTIPARRPGHPRSPDHRPSEPRLIGPEPFISRQSQST